MINVFSNLIGDASTIGLDCESGIVDDCNDGTNESAPVECSGIFWAPETTTKCGSQCSLGGNKKEKTSYKVNCEVDDTNCKDDDDVDKVDAGKDRFWLDYNRLGLK